MIELVIKIDEDVYTRLFDNGIQDNEIAVDDVCEMARALRLGTILPEHHGRLVDADWVKDILDLYTFNFNGCYGQFIRRDDIDTAPTIIEAEGSDCE